MSTRRVPGAQDLRADLLADLAGPVSLPGAEPIGGGAPAGHADHAPALELRVTPTKWALRRHGLHVQVGPVSVALTRD